MSEFVLTPRLAADSTFLADWPLCQIRLMEEPRYFWLMLIPRVADVTEVTELSPADRARLMEETAVCGKIVLALPGVKKLNIGSLGNQVPQFHMHVVVRAPVDLAWPGPMWGHTPRIAYEAAARAQRLEFFLAQCARLAGKSPP